MKLSVREKVAYGLGDTASNIVFQSVMLFLTYFYTDIYGISAAAVGTMFLVVRVIEAFTDPMMGALADRTRTRWGKFRPYLAWLAIPFGIVSVLAFTTPDFSEPGKIAYAFFSYLALMLVYTGINIPYSALGGVLTTDTEQRVSVQSYRFVFGMTGGLLVTSLTLPLVGWLGGDDPALGYQRAMMLLGSVGVVLFLLCFLGTKERVHQQQDQHFSLKQNFQALWANDQWRVLCLIGFFFLAGMLIRTSLAIYYAKYYLQLTQSEITLFVTVGMLGNLFGCSLAHHCASWLGKLRAYQILQWIAACLSALAFFIPANQVVLAFAAYFFWGFFLQMSSPILWAKMADTVDYGWAKTGQHITAMLYSSVVVFIKLGIACGGAIAAWLLAFYGYQSDSEQSIETLDGILWSFCILPVIFHVLVAMVARGYRLDEHTMQGIQQQLAAQK